MHFALCVDDEDFLCSPFVNIFLEFLKKIWKFLSTKFQIWTPKEAIVSVLYRAVFTFLRFRHTFLLELYWWYLLYSWYSNTFLIISSAILLWNLWTWNFQKFAIGKNKYSWNFQKLAIRENKYSQNTIFFSPRK